MRFLMAIALIALTGCSVQQEETSRSPLSKEEVLSLEIAAEMNDVKSIKALQVHYSFEGMDHKYDDLHQRLLKLGDNDALTEEATKKAIEADQESDNYKKKRLLLEGLALAEQAARDMHVKDISKDSTVQMIQQDLERLKSK
jgi:hypothetical protein